MRYSNVEYFEGIRSVCYEYLFHNYDYCYLSAMHAKNKACGADTIIIGNSHAMNGIIEKELFNAGDVISFCISSQDLYYNFMHLKKAVEEAKKPIKRCLVNLGYYTLHWDLSQSTTIQGMIATTYMNLFGEGCAHHFQHARREDLFQKIDFDRSMYPVDVIRPFVANWSEGVMLEQSSFYGHMMKREDNNMLGVQKVDWKSLNDEQKMEYANRRVINDHNRMIKYVETREENGAILREMMSFLDAHNIKTYFFITPYTELYMKLIDSRYREDIFSLLDELEMPVEFLDMNFYADIFSDADFIDSDHLNLQGAHKATAVLNGYIKMAEE
ncbi:hypothetical protein SAMN02910301_1329 [Lachnospiraceae bacterium XBD2001]|nr:hypothetical protein SAMN02910301_1329 [Lachnospiraceae bacterium XBD2001]